MNRVVATGWAIAFGCVWYAGQARAQTLTFTLDEVAGAAQGEGEAQASAPAEQTIAETLGELRWGMSKAQVLSVLKARIRADYDQRVKREADVLRQDALYQDARARFERIKAGFMAFDGRKTGWDVSPIADEFRHGSNESMLVAEDESARDLYFFVNGRLWKWYRELKDAGRDAARYEQLAEAMRGQFGRGKPQADRRSEGGEVLTGVRWEDEHTRMTLLRRGADTCVVFEDRAVLGRLDMLRARALPREPERNGALEQVFMTAAEREAWRRQQDERAAARSTRR